MLTKSIFTLGAMFALANFAFSQSGGMQVGMLDASVRRLRVETEFPLATDPGQVRVRVAKLPATTLETCIASMDFSSAVKMNARAFTASYNPTTGRESFGFGVEREMKDSGELKATCHVVRFAGSSGEGRDFLIWQGPSTPAVYTVGGANFLFADGSVRFIQSQISVSTF